MFTRKIRKKSQISFKGQTSRTKQSEKDNCDINKILRKYQKTSLLNHVNKVNGIYGDFSQSNDYHSSLNAVLKANDNFDGLPATLRAQFNNDPAQLLSFISDDKNYSAAEKLGLIPQETIKSNLKKKESLQQAKADALKPNDEIKTTT